MKEQVDKAFKEMLDISTDIDKAILFSGDEVLASNFPEGLQRIMMAKAKELASLGDEQASAPGSSPLTQLVVLGPNGAVFLVRENKAEGAAMLATGKRESRVGLVFYDMKTCIREARETAEGEVVTE